jgi:basic membrane protein A
VIAQHQDTAGPQQAAEDRGVYGVGYDADMSPLAPNAVLTSPIWHWSAYYIPTVQSVIDGTWESNQYWGGWKDGVVDLAPIADFVPEDVRSATEAEIEKFKSGEETIYTIFTGPINDQTGEVRVPEGQAMTDEELLGMSWFVEGVEGEIPS